MAWPLRSTRTALRQPGYANDEVDTDIHMERPGTVARAIPQQAPAERTCRPAAAVGVAEARKMFGGVSSRFTTELGIGGGGSRREAAAGCIVFTTEFLQNC